MAFVIALGTIYNTKDCKGEESFCYFKKGAGKPCCLLRKMIQAS